jgi:hypothetical protein
MPKRQIGASTISTIITLAILGYGVYVGIQYVPQFIEAKSIDSVLNSIERNHKTEPVTSVQTARDHVIKLLQINEMNEMTDNFKIENRSGTIRIKFSYDRELNLLYKVKPMHYEKLLDLR